MRNPQQLEALKFKLLKKGLPKKYVSRMMTELSEHGEDSNGDPSRPEGSAELIGDVDQMADDIYEKMKKSRFAGRHPIFSFIFSPVLAFVAFPVIVMMVTDLIPEDVSASPAMKPFGYAVYYFFKYILPFSVALVFCFLAKQSFCGYKWSFLACLALTVFFAPVFIALTPPIEGIPGSGTLQIGFGLPFWPGHTSLSVSATLKWLRGNYSEFWRYIPILTFGGFYFLTLARQMRESATS